MKLTHLLNEAEARTVKMVYGEMAEQVEIFDCSGSNLTSLEGCPEVLTEFACAENRLTSLEHGPTIVREFFNCRSNLLRTLEGSPQNVRLFQCINNKLTSLKGAPTKVHSFYCSDQHDNLSSLADGPTHVEVTFDCKVNNLKTLEGGPTTVGGTYLCALNRLTSLKGAPISVLEFDASNNRLENLEHCPEASRITVDENYLTSLQGAPRKVAKLSCYDNLIDTLEGMPAEVEELNLQQNKLTSLQGIHKHLKVCHTANFNSNPITSHILGLLKIKSLRKVALDNTIVEKIINKYLPLGNIFDCQAELEDAGYDLYAQL